MSFAALLDYKKPKYHSFDGSGIAKERVEAERFSVPAINGSVWILKSFVLRIHVCSLGEAFAPFSPLSAMRTSPVYEYTCQTYQINADQNAAGPIVPEINEEDTTNYDHR